MRKKKTIEEIKPAIELGDEYKLISEEYIGAHSKLEILHKFCGDVFQMCWNNFKEGQRCPGCAFIKRGLDQTLPFEKIKTKIDSVKNYKLLSKEYIGAHSKLEILHESCGDVFQMSWASFSKGQRCPGCSGKLKLTIEKIKPAIESFEDYKLLSKEYINAHSKLEILHESCGDVFQMSWASFSKGQRCPGCAIKNRSGENHYNWNPNLTDKERENGRNCPELTKWRKAVLDRDNDTCQKCLVRGGELEAHHILPWALFPELRFEVENGITLCKTCHDRYHFVWKYGEGCNPKTLRTHLLYNHEL